MAENIRFGADASALSKAAEQAEKAFNRYNKGVASIVTSTTTANKEGKIFTKIIADMAKGEGRFSVIVDAAGRPIEKQTISLRKNIAALKKREEAERATEAATKRRIATARKQAQEAENISKFLSRRFQLPAETSAGETRSFKNVLGQIKELAKDAGITSKEFQKLFNNIEQGADSAFTGVNRRVANLVVKLKAEFEKAGTASAQLAAKQAAQAARTEQQDIQKFQQQFREEARLAFARADAVKKASAQATKARQQELAELEKIEAKQTALADKEKQRADKGLAKQFREDVKALQARQKAEEKAAAAAEKAAKRREAAAERERKAQEKAAAAADLRAKKERTAAEIQRRNIEQASQVRAKVGERFSLIDPAATKKEIAAIGALQGRLVELARQGKITSDDLIRAFKVLDEGIAGPVTGGVKIAVNEVLKIEKAIEGVAKRARKDSANIIDPEAVKRSAEQIKREAASVEAFLNRVFTGRRGATTGELNRFNLAKVALIDLARQGRLTGAQLEKVYQGLATGSINQLVGSNRRVAQELGKVAAAHQKLGQTAQREIDKQALSFRNLEVALRIIKRLIIVDIAGQAIFALINSFRTGIETAQEFSISVAEIQTIQGEAGLTTETWRRQLVELSNRFENTSADVAEAAYQALSNQVVETADIFGFLNDALLFSKAAVTTAEDAVNLLSSAINAYGKSSADAAQLSAVFFKTIELGRVRASELANTFGTVLVPAAQLGIGVEEISAAMATLTIQGIKADNAMTLLRNVLLKLVKPTDEMTKLLNEFGFESSQAVFEANNLGEFLGLLNDYAGDNAETFGKLFGRLRALTGAFALTGDGLEIFNKNFKEISEFSIEEFFKKAEIVTESTGQAIRREFTKIQNFFQEEFSQATIEVLLAIANATGGLDVVVEQLLGTLAAAASAYGVYALSAVLATAASQGLAASTAALLASISPIAAAAAAATFILVKLLLSSESKIKKLQDRMAKARLEGQIASKERVQQIAKEQRATEKLLETEIRRVAKQAAAERKERNKILEQIETFYDRQVKIAKKGAAEIVKAIEKEINASTKVINQLQDEMDKAEERIAELATKARQFDLGDDKAENETTSSQAIRDIDKRERQRTSSIEHFSNKRIAQLNKERDAIIKYRKEEEARGKVPIERTLGFESDNRRLEQIEQEIQAEAEAEQRRKEIAAKRAERRRQEVRDTAFDENLDLTQEFLAERTLDAIELFDPDNLEQAAEALRQARAEGDIEGIRIATGDFEKAASGLDDARKINDEVLKGTEQNIDALRNEIEAVKERGVEGKLDTERLIELESELNAELEFRDTVLKAAGAQEKLNKIVAEEALEAQKETLTFLKEQLEGAKAQQILINEFAEDYKDFSLEAAEAWEKIAEQIANAEQLLGNLNKIKLTEAADELGRVIGVGKDFEAPFAERQENLKAQRTALAEIAKTAEDASAQLGKFAQAQGGALGEVKEEAIRLGEEIDKTFRFDPEFAAQAKEQVNAAFQAIEEAGSFDETVKAVQGARQLVRDIGKKPGTSALGSEKENEIDLSGSFQKAANELESIAKNTEKPTQKINELSEAVQAYAASSGESVDSVIDKYIENEQVAEAVRLKVLDTAQKYQLMATAAGSILNSTQPLPELYDTLSTSAETYSGKIRTAQQNADALNKSLERTLKLQQQIEGGGGEAAEGISGLFKAFGGPIYRANGGATLFKPRGTDTVPAMLTQDEFVVNRMSSKAWRPLLHAINRSKTFDPSILANFTARMTTPRYFASGGPVPSLSFGDININTSGNTSQQIAEDAVSVLKRKARLGILDVRTR